MKRALSALALGLSVTIISGCESAGSSVLGPATSSSDITTARQSSTGAGPVIGHSSGAVIVGESAHVDAKLGPDVHRQLAELRARMAPFHNFDKALADGYDTPAPAPGVCVSDPIRGGMGYHYTRSDKDLIGDGEVNLFEPEFLVYSPKKNGGVKFSALDYFVPYDRWPHEEPPSLLGIPFAREDGFQAYVLHIWLFWHNPAGMFENFNPDVPLC